MQEKTSEGFPIRTLCQLNQGTVNTKQELLRWVSELLTGHCHLKGHPFKMGLTDNPICETCLGKMNQPHTFHVTETIAYLRFLHLGPYCMELGDYQRASLSKVLHTSFEMWDC
jgi:hypothetical protein